jgi:hypothetical protein
LKIQQNNSKLLSWIKSSKGKTLYKNHQDKIRLLFTKQCLQHQQQVAQNKIDQQLQQDTNKQQLYDKVYNPIEFKDWAEIIRNLPKYQHWYKIKQKQSNTINYYQSIDINNDNINKENIPNYEHQVPRSNNENKKNPCKV